MPRYHFNVYDGSGYLDQDGTALPDRQAARLAAIWLAGEISNDEAARVALGEDWRREVTDATGLVLFQMTFLVVEAPAMLRDDHRES